MEKTNADISHFMTEHVCNKWPQVNERTTIDERTCDSRYEIRIPVSSEPELEYIPPSYIEKKVIVKKEVWAKDYGNSFPIINPYIRKKTWIDDEKIEKTLDPSCRYMPSYNDYRIIKLKHLGADRAGTFFSILIGYDPVTDTLYFKDD
jgi:hypothetical protein